MSETPLNSLDFILPNGQPTDGFVRVDDRFRQLASLSIDERAAINDAKSFSDRDSDARIDYVFFRRFSGERSSQVSAYIVDNTDERLDNKALAQLHRQVWLHGTAPLLYVAWPTRVDVLACARGADFWKNDDCEYAPARTIDAKSGLKTAGDIARAFSAFRLADGTFWEDPDSRDLADYTKAAHQSLIQAVVDADVDLEGEKNSVLRRLLLLMILVKYLEDRQVFPGPGWFGRWRAGAKSFFGVLEGGNPQEVLDLLDFLERKFNGDVFRIGNADRTSLTRTVLRRFAELVEARTIGVQRYLWEQYSFEHLPVEIISHLYQRFVQGGHGTVYTPRFLASLLLDYAMPYERLGGEERVLDPACGSGVFLVGAFGRLVNVWRSKHKWQKPDVLTLKALLKRSIHGIELDPFAVDLSAFSLNLALCDALRPEVIWPELKFDRLRDSNLFEADFFEKVLESRRNSRTLLEDKFDVIVGNPPFASKISSAGAKVDKAAKKANRERGSLPDKQAAYLFLEQSLPFLRNNGGICLLQPSGFLYNRNADGFRKTFLRHACVETILDLTSIRRLFEAADPKTIAVVARSAAKERDHKVVHLTFRRTASVHQRVCFELDHYDRHSVSQLDAETDLHVWRANFLGGGRLLDMSRRIRRMRTLAQYVDRPGWDYGEGFIAAKKGKRTEAPFLTGKPLLLTEGLTDCGIDKKMIAKVTETHFRSAYTESRYTPPLILLRENETLPVAFWEPSAGFLAYRAKVVGVHSPMAEVSALRELFKSLEDRHRFYRFWCTLVGSQSLVGKATAILKQDIDLLPYPEDPNDLDLSVWEQALCDDVLRYMTDYVRKGQNSALLKTPASIGDLDGYSNLLVRMLGTVYSNLQACTPVFLNGLACQPFSFGPPPDLSWLSPDSSDDLRALVYEESRYARLRTVRVLRYYADNVILVVKPDRLRYWIRSTAIRDADDTLIDLRQQGY